MSHSPFGLKAHQIAKIKSLKADDNFKEFLRLVEQLSTLHTEDLLRARDQHAQSYYQGYVAALRRVDTLLEEIITLADAPDAREQRRSRDAEQLTLKRKAALFGTNWWSPSNLGGNRF